MIKLKINEHENIDCIYKHNQQWDWGTKLESTQIYVWFKNFVSINILKISVLMSRTENFN